MLIYLLLLFSCCHALPERGHFDHKFNIPFEKPLIIRKSMFKGTYIDIKATCNSTKPINGTLKVWSVMIPCFNAIGMRSQIDAFNENSFLLSVNIVCSNNQVDKFVVPHYTNNAMFMNNSNKHLLTTAKEGIYAFRLSFNSDDNLEVGVIVDLRSEYGYLSAAEWPFLVFYSVLCGFYSLLALVWLILSCRNWRDILRIQFWIGAVIFLGMLEKALLVSEYESVNKSGVPLNYPVLIAEVVSCIKRMLARVLIMIVCIGYGIVKPRLGPAMKKIIGVGLVFLIAALAEGFIRVLHPDMKHSNYILVPNLVLVVTDCVIMWWSFSYLIQTIKEMRMRRNVVKFNLYRHFSNILIIVIIASVLFMAWFLYTFKYSKCVKSWNEVWINDAFWHVLFSVVLMTIMILWRPSKNSQRYAYSPLLDEENFDLEDEEEENVTMDNLTSGELRKPNKDGKEKKVVEKKTAEDDLRWIEENIPASAAEKIYPIVDSDEEITTTKLSSGKMD